MHATHPDHGPPPPGPDTYPDAGSWAFAASLPDGVVAMIEWFPGERRPTAISHGKWLADCRSMAEHVARMQDCPHIAGVVLEALDGARLRRCAFAWANEDWLRHETGLFGPFD